MRTTRGRGYVTRQHKHMAQTGHALIHKTWVCHDPATRPGKNHRHDGRIMTIGLALTKTIDFTLF